MRKKDKMPQKLKCSKCGRPLVNPESQRIGKCLDCLVEEEPHVKIIRHDEKPIKETPEEREWAAHEKGWDEGYEAGVVDFEEVERRKAEFRAKGIPVIGDHVSLRQRIKRFLKRFLRL